MPLYWRNTKASMDIWHIRKSLYKNYASIDVEWTKEGQWAAFTKYKGTFSKTGLIVSRGPDWKKKDMPDLYADVPQHVIKIIQDHLADARRLGQIDIKGKKTSTPTSRRERLSFGELMKRSRKRDGYWEEVMILDYTNKICDEMHRQGVNIVGVARRTENTTRAVLDAIGGRNLSLSLVSSMAKCLGKRVVMTLEDLDE